MIQELSTLQSSRDNTRLKAPKQVNPNITEPLKTRKVNIGSNALPKFTKISDYWGEDTVDKVAELLCEYHDLFLTMFLDLKGIVGHLGVMKITLKSIVNPVK